MSTSFEDLPTDNPSPTPEELITRAIEDALLDLHTGLPAKVLNWDAATNTVEVQPLLQTAFLDPDTNAEVVEDLPVLAGVPFRFWAVGGWVIHTAPQADDLVYLTFAERSLDKWKDTPAGQTVDPVESRHHTLSDAIAIPSIRPKSNPIGGISADLFIGREGATPHIKITAAGVVQIVGAQVEVGEGASQSAVLGEILNSFLTTLTTQLSALTLPVVGAVPLPGATPVAGPPAAPFAPPSGILSASVKVKP